MVSFIVYDSVTGVIKNKVTTSRCMLEHQVTPRGFSRKEIPSDIDVTDKIINVVKGTLEQKPPKVKTSKENKLYILSHRGMLLAASDWSQMPDSPLTALDKSAWKVYRQALRDITKQADPANIVWPTPPGVI